MRVQPPFVLWGDTRCSNWVGAWESGLISSWGGTWCPFHLLQESWGSSRVFIGETSLLLWCEGKVGIPLELKQGNRPSSWDKVGNTRLFLSCSGKLGGSSQIAMGVSGNILSCIKRVKPSFMFWLGTRDFSRSVAGDKGLISHWRGNLVVFLELRRED